MIIILKRIVAFFICNKYTGRIISILYNDQIPFFHKRELILDCNSKHICNSTKAKIFFGIYEGAEFRFCLKYIKNHSNIIELGSSIGFIAMLVSKYLTPNKLLLVEANPFLVDSIENNLYQNQIGNFILYNNAIADKDGCDVYFSFGEDTSTGSISKSSGSGKVKVPSIKLSSLVIDNGFSNYTLICDIEGAESFIFFGDSDALIKCDLLIIELHESSFNGISLNVNELFLRILELGFLKIDSYGNSFVFKKNTLINF